MARAITSPELTLLRSEGQWSKLYLAVLKPNTIYTARLASLPSADDQVYEIAYNTGSGTLSDVVPGMLLYVGTAAGAFDLGMCRIRIAPDATKIYIGETSEIDWAANAYLTIVDDFDIHPRHVKVDANGVLLMDVDIAYDDQHLDFDPVPVLGSHAVAELIGDTVDVQLGPGDEGSSWVFDSTITGVHWEIPDAIAIDDDTAINPIATFDTGGNHVAYCMVTAANGKTAMGIRYVFILDDNNPPATVFQLANCEGSVDSGGWMFDVTMQDEAALSEIRERTLVILFAKDYYQGTEQSIGPIVGRENIIAVGRIGPSETIRWDPVAGQVHFSVYGPHYWMNKIKVSACQLEFSAVPVDWGHITNLTVDRALWHLLHWRSTATMVMDFYPTLDTCLDDKNASLANYLWAQLNEFAGLKLMAHVLCDRYGRLFAEIDPQMIPAASRSSFPTVMTVTTADWMDVIDLERLTAYETGQVNMSTRFVNSSGLAVTFYSLSPGHMPRKHGEWEVIDGLLSASQAASNQKAGLYLGWKNNPFGDIPVKLTQNNRMIDICPHQVLDITVQAADTPRDIGYAGNLIPRRVALVYDAEARWLSAAINNEAETFEQISCNGDVPGSTSDDLSIPPTPKLPSLPSLPVIIPGTVETTIGGPRTVVIHDVTKGFLFSTDFQLGAGAHWIFFGAGLTTGQKQAAGGDLGFFFKTPSGACYCGYMNLGGTGNGAFVARAPMLGGTWTVIYDESNLWNGSGYFGVRGAAYNPLQPDTVGLVLFSDSDNTSHFYLGVDGVFTQGCAVSVATYLQEWTLSFGLNKWMACSQGNQPNGQVKIISADGSAVESTITLDGGNSSGQVRASTSGRTFHEQYSGGLYIGENNLTTYTKIVNADVVFGPYQNPFFATDPTGVLCMTNYQGSRGRSNDGASTWGTMSNLPYQTNYRFAYAGGVGVASRWIAVGGVEIYYSDDFGDSWTHQVGNLYGLIPVPNLDMIRVLGY